LLGGAALRIGSDAGLPVTGIYEVPLSWNGEIRDVTLSVPDGSPVPAADENRAALHGD
jgi:hypothetical protein